MTRPPHGHATGADWAAPFSETFRESLARLITLRRDIRAFRPDPVDPAVLRRCMELAHRAPSVGYAQPWRFLQVADRARIQAIARAFARANAEALAATDERDRALYARLKLEGIREAPVQMAVFCDEATTTGRQLGARTMPETRAYSVVCAIHTLWLALRAHGLGLGWVSILHPEDVTRILDTPPHWRFVAWLCIGHPAVPPDDTPQLERVGWERRLPLEKVWKTL
jgi:5,6-dimethylbenzimidazole synthase